MPRDSLLEIGARLHSSKWDTKSYLPIYDELFTPMRDEPITIVEIGICEGVSLRMWLEYFSKARIIGIDEGLGKVQRANKIHPRITAHQHLQHEAEVGRIMSTFQPDIIIDDAGHNQEDELTCFHNCWPHLKKGGLYIIEDIQKPEYHGAWRALGGEVLANHTSSRTGEYSYDDVLVIFRKE